MKSWKKIGIPALVVVSIVSMGLLYRSRSSRLYSPLHTRLELAANFGELRPDHFHMGIDIRTNGKENLPVYTIDEGYISRVLIEPHGYGKAVFVTHPNGITSLYAHLNRFTNDLESEVQKRQYAFESWQQDIYYPPEFFPVKKGELIAWSGNTGRSEGPHLHFELRDSKSGSHLNPALHGFSVNDNTPPVIKGLYWYDRRYSTYQADPVPIGITGKEGDYNSKRKIVKVSSPLVSLSISAEDRVDDSRFRYGIYRTQVWMDDRLIYDFRLDSLSEADAGYVNASIDYSSRLSKGLYLQHLARLPGNKISAIKSGDGLIRLPDDSPHEVRVVITDLEKNTAVLQFVLQRGSYDPVSNKLPEGARKLVPGKVNRVTSDFFDTEFSQETFYDSVTFFLKEKRSNNKLAASPLIILHNSRVPVHEAYKAKVKTFLREGDPLRQKTVMEFTGFKKKSVVKGKWEGNRMCGYFDELGTVQLIFDTIAPFIEAPGWRDGELFTQDGIDVTVADNLGSVARFRGELDGRWVLFSQHGMRFRYQFDKYCRPGNHLLKIWATDVAGNQTQWQRRFETR